MRICDTCNRLIVAGRPGGGGVKDSCDASGAARGFAPRERACPGHLKMAEFVNSAWRIRRHN